MKLATTKCFFTLSASGEGAQQLVSTISDKVACDIVEMTMLSEDFDHDVSALVSFQDIIKRATMELEGLTLDEKFNPLFLPNATDQLDELLEPQQRGDGVKFIGLDGNPFTIKMIEYKYGEEPLFVGKVQFYPFELPSYTEIIEAHGKQEIN